MNIDRHSLIRFAQILMIGALILLNIGDLHAQAQAAEGGTSSTLMFTGIVTVFFVFLIFFIMVVLDGDVEPLVRTLRTVYSSVAPKATGEAIPLDESHDGITELDNRVPPWFNYLFGGTILFGIVYLLNFHVLHSSPLPQAEYAEELAVADLSRRIRLVSEGSINEDELVPLVDDASVKSGQEQFRRNCITCHGARGEGIVGPNLTDQYWINGGGIRSVYTTIKNGVPQRGMISWKLVFTPKELQQIASYILSIQGSNPPNAKKPEGTLYSEPKTQPKDSTKVPGRS